jgi:UDP-glucose 4-epimerase
MTILVTGGAGYIGSHMVLRLIDAGHEVVVLDNLSTGFDWAVPDAAQLVVGDMGDADLTARVIADHKVASIIHFAASIVVPDSMADPLGYYRNNTASARTLIESAVRGGVQDFIFSSTAAVYGMAGLAPVAEDAPLDPMSPYGRSKRMVELMLADVAAAHGLRVGILRYFNVAGADPSGRSGQSTPKATHLIKAAVEAATGKRAGLSVFGTDYPTPDGTGVRDYIHVSDLVAAHALLLDYLRAGGANPVTFNCGYGHGASVRDVISTVERVAGVTLNVTEEPRRPGDPASVVAKSDRIRQVLGWAPAYDDLDLIITHALNWERQRRNRF